jgi:hypothetical protein
MGASVSIINFYENYMKKRESIVVGSPISIEHPPGIRNSNYKNKKLWKLNFNLKSKSTSQDKYEDEII